MTEVRLSFSILIVGDGDLNLHTRFDVDRGDLTHDLRWGMQIDDSLVDSHLKWYKQGYLNSEDLYEEMSNYKET